MTAPDRLHDLVSNFERNKDAYRSGRYNETQVRIDFINPLFELLGWDVTNHQGNSPAYQDVVHEDAIKVGGAHKAPDYGFRVGGSRKFFVEAKKPSVSINDNPLPAFQLRRYAWSARLPLSILTDFEEFAVYDCRVQPDKDDHPRIARSTFLTYDTYVDQWHDIAATFSREAVLAGSIDAYAETAKSRRGTSTVDAVFLKEIESWRELLARDLALGNPGLTRHELNFAVQMTIDRIVFLRMTEDRGIEDYGRLQALLNGGHVYERLRELYRQADERYNSGLFHFHPERGRTERHDELTLGLAIGDAPLKQIIRNLYYPDSPYEFSVLPIEVLGQVYEQFLGKVIDIAPDRQVTIEEKPEVRKAGGVYYTPKYIVDYIVEHTVGALLETKKPGPRGAASKLRIVDPACGSGSFLIGAYEYLLDWHRDRYIEDGPQKHRKELFQGFGGQWLLTTSEKKRILLNNIYGVDIDPQAVEVTKLSVVLEGETSESLVTQLTMFRERALPDLSNNIKCGNSLIGPDFYETQQMSFLDTEEQYRINVFDWKASFPQVFAGDNPGFDAVIGNPPYAYVPTPWLQNYFANHFSHQDYQSDLYLLFLERYQDLLRHEALLGVIVSNTWLQSVLLRKIRRHLTTNYLWLRILHLPDKVFRAVVDTHVLIFRKANTEESHSGVLTVDIRRKGHIQESHTLSRRDIPRTGDPVNVVASVEVQSLFRKIRDCSINLSVLCDVFNGVKPFEKGKGVPPQTAQDMKNKPYVRQGELPGPDWSPLLRGSLIHRYTNRWKEDYWIQYGPWLAAQRDPGIFSAPLKIMVRQTGDSVIATLVEAGFIARNNLHVLLPRDSNHDLRYVLGIMNSRLMDFAYAFMNPEKGGALAEIKKHHVEQLPIRPIEFSDPSDRVRHEQMISLVNHMLTLHELLAEARTDHDRTILQRQIAATDRQIDRLVCELYGLTDAEIAVVERAS